MKTRVRSMIPRLRDTGTKSWSSRFLFAGNLVKDEIGLLDDEPLYAHGGEP